MSARRLTRRRLFAVHRWVGAYLGLALFVVCSSGALAVLGHEWDWLADPARRADSTTMDWDAVGRTLDGELGNLWVVTVSAPVEPGHAAVAVLQSPRGQIQTALLEPATGALRGRRNVLTIQVYLRQFHKTFVAPYGLYVVGSLGLALLVSSTTGIVVYRRFWQHMARLRLRGGLRVAVADLHRTLGVWSLLLALVVAITGVWYLVEAAAHDVADAHVEPDPPRLSEARLRALGASDAPLSLGEVVAAAREAMPGLEVRRVLLPESAEHPVRVDGQTGALLVRDRASRVYLDPYSGAVLGTQRAEALPPLHRWSDMADPLHFGDFAGLWSKLPYLLLGVLLSIAVLAGPVLGELRRRQRSAAKGPARAPSRRPAIVAGSVAAVTVAVAVAASWFGYGQPFLRGHPPPSSAALVDAGPWRVLVTAHDASEGGAIAHRIHPLGSNPPTWTRAELVAGDEAEPFREATAWATDPTRLRLVDVDGAAHEAPLALGPTSAPAVAGAVSAVGLDEAPLAPDAYVLAFIVGLLVFELLGVLLWLGLLVVGRRPGSGKPAPAARRSSALAIER